MENKIAISLIVGVVVIFLIGTGAWYMLQVQPSGSACQPAVKCPEVKSLNNDAIKVLSSNFMLPITASGKVTKIDGKNITLGMGNESVVVKIGSSAKIYPFVASSKDTKSGTLIVEGKFEDIKVGNNIKITVKVLSTGSLEGQIVNILDNVTK